MDDKTETGGMRLKDFGQKATEASPTETSGKPKGMGLAERFGGKSGSEAAVAKTPGSEELQAEELEAWEERLGDLSRELPDRDLWGGPSVGEIEEIEDEERRKVREQNRREQAAKIEADSKRFMGEATHLTRTAKTGQQIEAVAAALWTADRYLSRQGDISEKPHLGESAGFGENQYNEIAEGRAEELGIKILLPGQAPGLDVPVS